MLFELLRLLAALLLLVVLPGFLLVQAAFPPARSRVTMPERAYLTVIGGVVILILVGVTLGFLPHGDRGWFQTSATGMPNVEICTALVSLALFYVGLHRGAFPAVAKRFPRLVQPDGRRRDKTDG